MGNYCANENIPKGSITRHIIFEKIENGTDSEFSKLLKELLPELTIAVIDDLTYNHKGNIINPLGYCLLLGKSKKFQTLRKANSDLALLEKILAQNKLNALSLICSHGLVDLLEDYVHTAFLGSNSIYSRSSRVFDTGRVSDTGTTTNIVLPFHIACAHGKINIVDKLYDICLELLNIPIEFNIETRDEIRGENCALVACRYGNKEIVHLLYTKCKADFHAVNNSNESAVMVCLAGMKNKENTNHFLVIKYLIETIKVNIKENYEEVLLLAENDNVIKYLECQLHKLGITETKKDIEKKNIIIKASMFNTREQIDFDTKKILSPSFMEDLNHENISNPSTRRLSSSIGSSIHSAPNHK